MKSLMLFTSLLLGATASPVKQRQATTHATVSGFSASTIANGNGATIAYDIKIPGLDATHCSYSDGTSGSRLPAVEQTQCENKAVRWQFRQDPSLPGTEGRYRIVIIHTLDSGVAEAGFHEWVPADFPTNGETVYTGPSEFVVDFA